MTKTSSENNPSGGIATGTAPAVELHECVQCHLKLGRDGFFKKQWKLRDQGRCCGCWNTYIQNVNNQRNGPKRKAVAEEQAKQKRQKVATQAPKERRCRACRVMVDCDNSSGRWETTKQCDDCIAKVERALLLERNERLLAQKKDYMMTFGVGYGLGHGHRHIKNNEYVKHPEDMATLVGDYQVVFYQSENDEDESISRTAKGRAELTMSEWGGKSALYGWFQIDTYSSSEHAEDDTSFYDFIEMPNSKYSRHFNGSSDSQTFLLGRGADGKDWWKSLPEPDCMEDVADEVDFCGGDLVVFKKRMAVPYEAHRLPEKEFEPANVSIGKIPESLDDAEDMMKEYRKGDSWMCKHMGLSQELAFRIREFLTPPPVFFFEEGDLVVNIDESAMCEWTKTVVLRKKS